MRIAIQGFGVAGASCAWLLARRGFAVTLHGAPPTAAGARTVVIPPSTVELFEEIWDLRIDELPGAEWTHRRRVAWAGRASEIVPSAGVALSMVELLGALEARLDGLVGLTQGECGPAPDWTLVARGRGGGGESAGRICGGQRRATEGWLAGGSAPETVLAAVERGWLFVAPRSGGGAALTLVSPERWAGAASLAAAAEELGGGAAELRDVRVSPCSPSFDPGCARPGRLCVGNAALTIDPLRGDGVGFALREAILASAVIAASERGVPEDVLARHYRDRLAAAFRAHVISCIAQYGAAWNAPVWVEEVAHQRAALQALGAEPPLPFVLRGFDLHLAPA
jgi:2-polyprenyl-6-methoxyphenol hydroxylase-like FAD-dependent oxidoreductase